MTHIDRFFNWSDRLPDKAHTALMLGLAVGYFLFLYGLFKLIAAVLP
jgi:hypothetical protein